MKNLQRVSLIIERISDFFPDIARSKKKKEKATRKSNFKNNKKYEKIQKKALYNSMLYGYY